MSKKTNNYKKGGKTSPDKAKKDINKKYSDPRDQKSKSRDAVREEQAAHYEDRAGDNILKFANADQNDPSWYFSSRKLVEDATKVSFGAQTGLTYNLGDTVHEFTDPGICVLKTQVTPGLCKTSTDAGNMSAIQTFEYVRKHLGTIAEYTSADFFMRNYGIMNIFALYCHIMRAFGTANLYSAYNMYYPRDLLRAVYGWTEHEVQDFISNGANYMYRFNNIINKASALYMPMDFTYMQRYSWLFLNYWVDHESRKAQIYAHTPVSVYELDETTYDTGTALTPTLLYGLSMTQLLDTLNRMIERYRSSSSMQKIQADMERAFEQRSSWKLAYCDQFFMCIPGHSSEVLSQIENATVVPAVSITDFVAQWTIKQDVDLDIAIFDPAIDSNEIQNTLGVNLSVNESKPILNLHWNDPTIEDVVVATRNTVTMHYEEVPEHEGVYKFDALPSDIIVEMKFYDRTSTGLDAVSLYNGLDIDYDIESLDKYLRAVRQWAIFDWAPMFYLGYSDHMEPMHYGELDNFGIIDGQVLTNIHTAVCFSMWSIPEMGLLGT